MSSESLASISNNPSRKSQIKEYQIKVLKEIHLANEIKNDGRIRIFETLVKLGLVKVDVQEFVFVYQLTEKGKRLI